jgi:DNA-directed RNA polymerase subunit delta
MAVALSKTNDEIQQLPLVELAFEILKTAKEPMYFRDLMNEIAELRNLSEEEVMDVIARLYTEINIDGRFLCIGQNVWGLKRWYPVDKVAEKTGTKRFVRASGDAFSDDDEDMDDEFGDLTVDEDVDGDLSLFDDLDGEADAEDEFIVEDEDTDFAGDEAEEPAFEETDEFLAEDGEAELEDEDENV